MVRVIMHGYQGSMGKIICEMLKNDISCEIVAGVDQKAISLSETFPIYCDIKDCDMPADVIIDFSIANCIDDLVDYAVSKNTSVVICTTALSKQTLEKIEDASKYIPIFRSANMSLGINLIADMLQKATKILSEEGFDVEIIEKHHNKKIDAPSGTALLLADSINEVLDNKLDYVYDRSKTLEKREPNELGIHSVRGGTIVGEHSVIFAGKDEVLELKHSAYSKEVFAVGAIKAAKFLYDKTPGMYQMKNLMDSI